MEHIHGGNIYKYEKIEDFSANINFRGMPEAVRQAALAAVERSVHYPDPDCARLKAALAARERVEETQLLCGNGAAELMFALTFALRPRRALLAEPSFFEYEQALEAAGCHPEFFYLEEAENFRVGEAFLERLNGAYDMVILGNPNNPTGQLIEKEILGKILERCREKGTFLVMDESFFDFLTEEDRGKTAECAEHIGEYRNLLVIKSFTKMYAMPGLRFGYCCGGDRELLKRMRSLLQPWNVSLPAQMAAEAAASEEAFARETAEMTAENREWMAGQLRRAGYRVLDARANYLMLRGPENLARFCLERGILIRDCGNFRGLSRGWYRVCVCGREENQRLLRVLEAGRSEER